MKWRMTFRHLYLFKIIRPLVMVVVVSLEKLLYSYFVSFKIICLHVVFYAWIILFVRCFNWSYSYTHFPTIFYFRLPMLFSLSPFRSHFHFAFFFDRYKTARRVRLYSRRFVSFRLFRSRRFGFALRAFNLFASSPYTSMCMLVSLCLCQLLILYKHTHTRMRACAHTHKCIYVDDDGKRDTPKKWVEERERESKRHIHIET